MLDNFKPLNKTHFLPKTFFPTWQSFINIIFESRFMFIVHGQVRELNVYIY